MEKFNRDAEISAIHKLNLEGFISDEKANIDILKCIKNEERINKWIEENYDYYLFLIGKPSLSSNG